jgi:hypothetical protein
MSRRYHHGWAKEAKETKEAKKAKETKEAKEAEEFGFRLSAPFARRGWEGLARRLRWTRIGQVEKSLRKCWRGKRAKSNPT